MKTFLRNLRRKCSTVDNICDTWNRSQDFLRLELKNIKWKNAPATRGCAYIPTNVSKQNLFN